MIRATSHTLLHDHTTIIFDYMLGKWRKSWFLENGTWGSKMTFQKSLFEIDIGWLPLASQNFWRVRCIRFDNIFYSKWSELHHTLCFMIIRPLFWIICMENDKNEEFFKMKGWIQCNFGPYFGKSKNVELLIFKAVHRKI